MRKSMDFCIKNKRTMNSLIIHYDNNLFYNFILNEMKPMIAAFCQHLSILVLKMVVQVPFGVVDLLLQNIATTPVRQMVVLRGIKPVANGRMGNAFPKWRVSSLSPMWFW